MRTYYRFRPTTYGLPAAIIGFVLYAAPHARVDGEDRNREAETAWTPAVNSSAMRALHVRFASLEGDAVVYPDGMIIMVGQSLSGETTNSGYRMCVGAIEGLLLPSPGDFDGNRRVDLADLSELANCMMGPNVVIGPDCRAGDGNQDGDVDLGDAAAFQRGFDAGP